jgi:F-type H+-transporting ATPase subunit gamma
MLVPAIPTLDALQRTVATVENLQGIVRTMKTLAAVSIRQYEQAVAAVAHYERAVRLGLTAVLGESVPVHPQPTPSSTGKRFE